jgi:hypothetical protein
MSLALFTSTAVANANGFTTGTIIIGIAPVNTIFTLRRDDAGRCGSGRRRRARPSPLPIAAPASSATAITGIATNAPLAALLVITIKQPDGNAATSCALFTGTTLNTITTVATTHDQSRRQPG